MIGNVILMCIGLITLEIVMRFLRRWIELEKKRL